MHLHNDYAKFMQSDYAKFRQKWYHCTQIYSIHKRIFNLVLVHMRIYQDIQASSMDIKSCISMQLYILICTEYRPVYTQYNIAFFRFSFTYEKSKAMQPYISRYTQIQIISRVCPGSQLSKGFQILMRKQAYISVCTVAYLKTSSFISNPSES